MSDMSIKRFELTSETKVYVNGEERKGVFVCGDLLQRRPLTGVGTLEWLDHLYIIDPPEEQRASLTKTNLRTMADLYKSRQPVARDGRMCGSFCAGGRASLKISKDGAETNSIESYPYVTLLPSKTQRGADNKLEAEGVYFWESFEKVTEYKALETLEERLSQLPLEDTKDIDYIRLVNPDPDALEIDGRVAQIASGPGKG